ncbi:DUF3696 domain-containing protein [Pseudomonas syringae pv. actinidiae]|nr:DUF3696 domain-containing protein [Pseudomonas syringae pv. actinidiae]
MGKLIIHVGDFSAVPTGTEVPGGMTDQPSYLSSLGRALRAPEGSEDRHVFTNNENIFSGVRIAVRNLDILTDDLDVIFHNDGAYQLLQIRQNGQLSKWPKGLFDQLSLDLRELATKPKSKETTQENLE